MRKFIAASFVFLTAFILLVYLSQDRLNNSFLVEEIGSLPPQNLENKNDSNLLEPSATIIFRDLRVEAVNKFLDNYGPKMRGLGEVFVSAADKAGIPYNIVPAIGACEGGLGNAIPKDSYNTWGWGVYGGKVKKFPNWETAIWEVSQGLAREYFAKGLDTPEKIMPKYAPRSTGSWAECVNKYLAALPNFD